MTPQEIQAYLQLYAIAFSLGESLYLAVKGAVAKTLSPAELAQLAVYWDEDVARSALNAGIPYVPPTPLPPVA